MCLRKNRHFLALLFTGLLIISGRAQTLHWIGGSGSFNDPKHWSLTSGGPSAGIIPGPGTDVLFDDKSGEGLLDIRFPEKASVRSFSAANAANYINFESSPTASLFVSGSFSTANASRNRFNYQGAIFFRTTSATTNYIDFGAGKVKASLFFREGNFRIASLNVAEGKKVGFDNGSYTFSKAALKAEELVIKGKNTAFRIDTASFYISRKVLIADEPSFASQGFGFLAPFHDSLNVRINKAVNFGSQAKLSNNHNVMAAGEASLYALTSCSGSCSATFSLVIDAANTGVYDLVVTNTACPMTAASISTTGLLPGSSFVVNNVCFCPGQNFSPNLFDPVTFEFLSIQILTGATGFGNFNFVPPSLGMNPLVAAQPSCNLSCNGGMTLSISGGAIPYTVNVSGPVNSSLTTNGLIPLSGLCKGTYTLVGTDANGCSTGPVTRTLTAPSLLQANPVTSSITCHGLCNGSFSVNPAGTGSPGYTVSFSNGYSVATTSAAAISSLCIGPVSATVTDSRGCTTSVSSTISQPVAPLSAVPSQTNLICNNVCTGAAAANVSGGTAPYQYNWSPVTGTNASVSSLCAGIETLTITDVNGCSLVQTYTVTEPPAIILIPTSTNVVCSGSCTGAASVTASGGVGAFTYTWVAPENNTISVGPASSVGNLCAGDYTVYVSDSPNNCRTSIVIQVTEPPTVTLTTVSQSVSCFGANNGSATVTATGGNGAPYTYSWTPGGMTTSVITNLAPNVYQVAVRDASFCVTYTQVTIIEPSGLVPTVTHTNLTCNATNSPCDGRIHAAPVGGVLPYSYSLVTTSGTLTTPPPYNNLCSGNYTVIVRDASGCPQQSLVTLSQPAPLVASIVNNSVACYGANTASLSGSASGGIAPYTLQWSSASGTISGNPLFSQPAGNYTLTVTDSQSCSAQASVTIAQPSSITISVGTSSISCYSMCNGVLNSTVSGGTPGYNLVWTNSLNINVGTGATVSSLCPGLYTLTVRDANLCVRTATGEVLSPPPIVLTASTTPVNCFGDSNGSATITATGGTPSYTYHFNSTPTVTNTTGILSGQPAGNYTATITDLAACVRTVGFNIASPVALTAAITGTGSCNVCTGSATISPSFGTGPYTVSWSSSLGGSLPSNTVITGLCPGDYTATVTDSKNCVVTRQISLNQVINVSATPAVPGILCYGASTGSATASASGGTGVYTYSWSTSPAPQTTSVLTGVPAGTYIVRVTDSSIPSACSHTASVVITQPPAMTVTATQTNVTCFGFSNGAVSASVSGGEPGVPVPYTYTWSPGGENTSAITGLVANIYTLNVRDGNLCQMSTTIQVTQPASISIALAITNPAGCVPALANGSICATPSGGSGSGYTYTLMPNGIANTSGCFTGLGGGAYLILVNDGVGCANNTVTTLSPPSGPTISVSAFSVACHGYSTGVASATVTGMTPSFDFSWTPAVSFTSAATTSSANNIPAGVYFVTAVDGNSCVATQSVQITQAPAYTLNPVVSNLRCHNLPTGSITVQASGGTPAYTYSWLPAGLSGQGTATVSSLPQGTYTLQLSDAHNCVTPYTFTVTQPSDFTVTAVTSSLSCFNVCTGSIVAQATGGTGALSYSWSPSATNSPTITGLCATGGTNPAAYTLTVTDQNTCSAVQTYTLAEPLPVTSTVQVQSATCSNSCNAIASQTASGGVGGYSYSWSSAPVTTSTLGGLCAGTYSAIVTDANGCVHEHPYSVIPPTPISVTLTPSNPLCDATCNASITTLVSGAQGPVVYSWLPAGTGQNPTGLCASPVAEYTLVATDQNNCQVTAVATLTNPSAIQASVNAVDPLCHNELNGQASVSYSNAVGAVSYTWLPMATPVNTPQVSGLSPGIYTVLLSDANHCQTSQTFTLMNPPVLTLTTASHPASCSQTNGSITVHPSGGTPGSPVAYTYSWTGVASSSSVVTGLGAGMYTVYVTDKNGCSARTSLQLNNSSGPNVIPVISSSVSCNAQCTGAASVDLSGVQGGIAPYTVSWQAPAPAAFNPVNNLCAGIYIARVEDANGCVGFTTVTISEPPPLQISPVISQPLCAGVCDGSILVNTSGGLGAYTYSWSPVASTSSVITNLCADDYVVTVGYNNGGCTVTTLITIADQTSITIVPTVTNNTCYGSCNAAVDIAVTGGSVPYQAGWSNGQTGFNLNNMCSGSYTVIVTDNNGCSNTITTSITSAPQLVSTAAVSSPSCGMCNGSASVSVSGGTSPFTFNWTNAATTPNVSNLCAGVYEVVVTDAQACSETHTVVVNNSSGITGETITDEQIPCSGSCVGAATVSAIGGTSPISYNWLNPAVSGSVISNLCPGTYYVQMSDGDGCVRIASVAIDPAVTLTVSPFVSLPTCGMSNGSVNVVIAGGTPAYQIVWNPPVGTTSSLTNLSSGLYSFTVTESGTHSCSVSHTIQMSNFGGPEINYAQADVVCAGDCSGAVFAGSTSTNTPLTYAWSNGLSTPDIIDLCKGVVTLTLTDVGGCSTIQSFTISETPTMRLGLSHVTQPLCFGDCNGSITLMPSGGMMPYTYSWTSTEKVTNPVESLCDGVYTARVFDARGCVISSPSYTIKSTSAIGLSATSYSSSCSSVADGTIILLPSGGTPNYQYAWTGPGGYTADSQDLINVRSGSYTVEVSDNYGCKKDSVLSIVPSITVVANAGTDQIICPGTGSVLLNAGASAGSVDYRWYPLGNRSVTLASGPTLQVGQMEEPASFIVVALSAVPECVSEDTVRVNVFNRPAVDAGRDFTVPVHSTVTIGGYPSHWGAVTLTWSPAMYLNDATISNPQASNTVNVTYTLTITDANGCTSSDTVRVHLYPKLNLTSGFTPNGDGKNDYWIIDHIEQFPQTVVEIYNRWGERIFSSNGYHEPFDGKYKGSDLPVGTYYYIINLNHPGYPKPITGPLTIFR